jgi:hypothetical protein
MNDDALSDAERQALASLKRDLPPPRTAEGEIISALRARGLLRSPRSEWLRRMTAAAAVTCAFGSGALWQRSVRSNGNTQEPRFMLLLYGGDTHAATDRRAEYAGWARTVGMNGTGISGEELSDMAAEVPGSATMETALSAPRPRGYFIISTSNIDEAKRIAASCPHLRFGGRIVIRPIVSGSSGAE